MFQRSDEFLMRRFMIIEDILRSGLKSAKFIHEEGRRVFSSGDIHPEETSFISGVPLPAESEEGHSLRKFLGAPPGTLKEFVQAMLYAGAESILPVLLERSYGAPGFTYYDKTLENREYTPPEMVMLHERAMATFLVVIKISEMDFVPDTFPSVEHHIPPQKMAFLVFPENVWADYLGAGYTPGVSSEQVILVDKMVRRLLGSPVDATIQVPDYESVLLELLQKERQSLWVHGVRLPTPRDSISLQ